ncbi:TetR/AcrR family transcriptional regulator [uncultured Xylophilus sp.]|uniref:TetR/AcrR family transcriptional regulator n=1 Tax=uncultured Xylophilus sp. TaxID=296832 RepID=UPI0025DA1BA0|nr:TetR/AcrR family transcriptional regulator [uncultured Xylophilus sp.]
MKTPHDAQPAPRMRKQPVQARAQRTIETIFAATAQIVESDGEGALTTNRIAEKAGFSIGTLYQYFPSKEAILLAMIGRQRDRTQQDLQAMLDRAVAERWPVREAVRELVALLVQAFGGTSRPRRAFIRMAWRIDHHDNITQALREGADRNATALAQLIAAGDAPGVRPPTPVMMFVATRAVMGVIRSASLEDSPLLGTPAFEDELVRLVCGLLAIEA